MKALIDLLAFVQKRQGKTEAMTKAAAILSDGPFGPHRRPALTEYNTVFEEEAQWLMMPLFQVPRTGQHCFALAELFKFGVNDYFPGLEVEIDYARASYWFVAAADLGHKGTIKFFHRMVPQYFMKNVTPGDMLTAVIEALVEQESLAKANHGESIEARKWREAVNDFVIDAFLYPEEYEIDTFWFDTIGQYLGQEANKGPFCKNNVRPLFKF